MVTVKDSSGNKQDVKVELGLATKEKVEIISGLKVGDIVVYNAVQLDNSSLPSGMMMPAVGGKTGAGGVVIKQEGKRP
jgi:hypothetical protein